MRRTLQPALFYSRPLLLWSSVQLFSGRTLKSYSRHIRRSSQALRPQTGGATRDYLAEYRYDSAKAAHTERYLWPYVISLCAGLGVRRVVDIGCGNGALCRELASRGYEVVGCEPSADEVRLARSAATELVFHQIGVDDHRSQVGDESFDVAIATEVIEHLVRPRNLLRFAKELLRPGGHLIISRPYHGYVKNLVLALTNKWDTHLTRLSGTAAILSCGRAKLSPSFEGRRFPARALHWSGKNSFAVEKHDHGCTEARRTRPMTLTSAPKLSCNVTD
jgi:2-polyprenyl-3-methyl-5-hydroxy-6-metoxy-1,4-benzoquinol methylase